MEKERKRAYNYTTREKEILISLVENNITILENKKTNAVFNKEKIKCWEQLAREYNALQTTGIRTATQLRAAYDQMKKIAKQHKSEDKVEMLKTGGGIFIPKLTSLDEKILSLLKDNYFTIENKFDSNVGSDSFRPTSPLPMTSSETENIFVMYENDDDLEDNIQENEAQKIMTAVEEDSSNIQVIDIDEPIRDEPNRKRVKLSKNVRSSKPKDLNSDMKGKKDRNA